MSSKIVSCCRTTVEVSKFLITSFSFFFFSFLFSRFSAYLLNATQNSSRNTNNLLASSHHIHLFYVCFCCATWTEMIFHRQQCVISSSSDGKVRIYRLSSAIRRLSQESRWQPSSSHEQNHHKATYPVSLIPTPRNRQRRPQHQFIINMKPRKVNSVSQ